METNPLHQRKPYGQLGSVKERTCTHKGCYFIASSIGAKFIHQREVHNDMEGWLK